MGRLWWLTYLWPGLPQICREGAWSGLATAIGFAALVNLGLSASLLWSELFVSGVRNLVWVAVVVVWGVSAAISYRRSSRLPSQSNYHPARDTYGEALDHYLKGNWFESEHLLQGLLANNPRDLDARLMLATLFRRTDRGHEAGRQLDQLERFDGSEKWETEISRERKLLEELQTAEASGSDRTSDLAPADGPNVSDAA